MNYDTEYPTKKAKNDKIKELEKEFASMTKKRDDWMYKFKDLHEENVDCLSRIDAMQTAIYGQKELADNLLAKNKELVAQIRELEKLEIDAPVDLVPTIKATSEELGVHLLPAGNYTIELVDGRMKIIGVAK